MNGEPRSLVVFLDESDIEGRRLDFTLSLAARYRAHVIGLFVETMPKALKMQDPSLRFARGDVGVDDTIRRSFSGQYAASGSLRERLETSARQSGHTSEWRHIVAFAPIRDAMRHCFYADLAILPPQDETSRNAPWSSADIVVSSGVPGMLVPRNIRAQFPSRIMIAWNASRVARRALGDALSFLKMAERVTVVVVDAEHEASLHGEEPGSDIARFLAHHDVEAVVERLSTDGVAVSQTLIQCAKRLEADLIVAGAYGHARFVEFVLGSTTRAMLGGTDLAFLISH